MLGTIPLQSVGGISRRYALKNVPARLFPAVYHFLPPPPPSRLSPGARQCTIGHLTVCKGGDFPSQPHPPPAIHFCRGREGSGRDHHLLIRDL